MSSGRRSEVKGEGWAKTSPEDISGAGHPAALACALLVGVLTLYSMTKIWAEAFWKEAPEGAEISGDQAAIAQKWPYPLVLPCVGLALLTLGLGLWSNPLFTLADKAANQLLKPEAYIQAVLKTSDHETYLALDD